MTARQGGHAPLQLHQCWCRPRDGPRPFTMGCVPGPARAAHPATFKNKRRDLNTTNDLTDPLGSAEAAGMLEKLFSLSERRCSGCGALHKDLEQDGITDPAEWEELVGYGLCWAMQ